MAFRRSSRSLRLFGIGAKESERHREARFQRFFDNLKLLVFTIGVMAGGVGIMQLGRRTQLALNPKSSSRGMAERIDEVIYQRPDLAVAVVKMALHHPLSGAKTPFGAPMVCPPYLISEAKELEKTVEDLMTFSHDFSPADIWALLVHKALRSLGGPDCLQKSGRSFTATSMRVEIRDALISDTDRDAHRLKAELTRRGLRASDIVALVGVSRSIGYHPHAHVSFDKEKMMFVDTDESNDSLYRKTTTHPFIFGNDYYNELVEYQWQSEKDKKISKAWYQHLFEKSTPIEPNTKQNAANELYRCIDDEKAALRVKYIIRSTPLSSPMTLEEAQTAEEAAKNVQSTPMVSTICDKVTMQGIDVSLLDDTLLAGWTNRFADDEKLFFVETAKIVENTLSQGYELNSLRRTHGV